MNAKSLHLVLALASAACAAGPALGVEISGLSPLGPLEIPSARITAEDGTLLITGEHTAPLRVTPWPRYLPQRFAAQQVSAARRLHPAGPSDRIELHQPGHNLPWLIVATGMRREQPVLADWVLMQEDGRWMLRRGKSWRTLRAGSRAAHIEATGRQWCVYLLDAQQPPQASPGTAAEGEPQADVAIVQAGNGHCPRRHAAPPAK